MAMNGSPSLLQPTVPSNNPLPQIPHLSPQTSSSSDSFDSSQLNSQASSTTSRSVSPTPIPKSVPKVDSQESFELPILPSNPILAENASTSQTQPPDDPPRSAPSGSAASSTTNRETSWFSYLARLVPRGNGVSNTLGSLNFGLTLIGMLIFGKIAVWTARNDAFTTCVQIFAAGRVVGENCRNIASNIASNNTLDVQSLPYGFGKRGWDVIIETSSRLKINNMTKRSSPSAAEPGNSAANFGISNISFIAVVLVSTVIIGGLSFIVFRRYWTTEEVLTSPVKADWRFIRHPEEGPETVSEERYHMIKHNPEGSHPLDGLRQRIRSSQPNAVDNPLGESACSSHNSSEETLIGPWDHLKWGTSKVSITNDESDKKHVNLIELETKGPNKTFFDPETREFIHLTPWKSTGDVEVHGLRPDRKGSIKQAFARMTVGATGWAGGKSIDDQLAEELQASSKGEEEELGEPKAGDCITGNTINKAPSGKPGVV